jgi:hypothetical protein
MFSRSACLTVVLSIAFSALADVNPTSPGPGQVFQQGGTCTIGWDPDTTGTWKTLNVELMTGPNLNMVHLTSPSCSIFFSSDHCLTITLLSNSCRYRRWYHLPWHIQLPVSCGTCHGLCHVYFSQFNVLSIIGQPPRTYLFLPVLFARVD